MTLTRWRYYRKPRLTTGWTLQPPTKPGRYQYRQHRECEPWDVVIVAADGLLWVEQPVLWIDFSEWDGEWRRR